MLMRLRLYQGWWHVGGTCSGRIQFCGSAVLCGAIPGIVGFVRVVLWHAQEMHFDCCVLASHHVRAYEDESTRAHRSQRRRRRRRPVPSSAAFCLNYSRWIPQFIHLTSMESGLPSH